MATLKLEAFSHHEGGIEHVSKTAGSWPIEASVSEAAKGLRKNNLVSLWAMERAVIRPMAYRLINLLLRDS